MSEERLAAVGIVRSEHRERGKEDGSDDGSVFVGGGGRSSSSNRSNVDDRRNSRLERDKAMMIKRRNQ